jgi:hypothetical protein
MSYALLGFLADGEVGVANMFIGGRPRAQIGGEDKAGARVVKITEGETGVLDTLGLSVIDRATGYELTVLCCAVCSYLCA